MTIESTLRPAQRAATQPIADVQPRRAVPVKWWAALGAAFMLFEVVVLTRWITGPLFKAVPVGTDDPPTFMKVAIVILEVTCIPAALLCLYFIAVRPWRRAGRLTTDGAMAVAFSLLWFQDPLSVYFGGPWFSYNSWQLNRGSWVNSIPGALAPAHPGAMTLEPLLIIPGVYVWWFTATMFLVSWVMRRAKGRWPRMGTFGLCGVAVLGMFVFDFVMEGLIFMPLGIWEYPGGHLSIFPNTYHKFPLSEMLTAGSVFALVGCVRFFKNDRGETLAERGIEQLRVSEARRAGIRVLAMIGMTQLLMIVCYNLPNAWNASHSAPWPKDLYDRTYLNMGICGKGTQNACPVYSRSVFPRGD